MLVISYTNRKKLTVFEFFISSLYHFMKLNNEIVNPTMSKLQNQASQSMNNISVPQNIILIESPSSFFSSFSSQNKQKNAQSDALMRLFQLYLSYGPSWKFIKSEIGSEQFFFLSRVKDPKNFIYNAIRRAAKELAKCEVSIFGRRRRFTSRDTLLCILQIVNQMQKEIMSRHLTLNEDCQLFRFKKTLLKFSLLQSSMSLDQICQLISTMKEINLKLRCLSIFKVKNRKNWKISEKALMLISSFDRIILESQFEFELFDGKSKVVPKEKSIERRTEEKEQNSESPFVESIESLFWSGTIQTWREEKSLEDEANQILRIKQTDINQSLLYF